MIIRVTVETSKGGPTAQEQAQLLYNRWIVDVPKVMDVAALYGRANPDLTRRFMQQARAMLCMEIYHDCSCRSGTCASDRKGG